MERLDSTQLVQVLRDIERRSRQMGAGLPQEEVIQSVAECVPFSVGGVGLVAPLSEVREILNYPSSVTRAPGTKKWVSGVANIRGNLLPIIDLQIFLGGNPILIGRRSRVLVINHQNLFVGLLVGDVQGMRHFQEQQRVTVPNITGPVGQYVRTAFSDGDKVWPVFSMNLLAESPGFQVAAA
ncbi:MAG: chemotaxis protein CheW [Gammaproteobacteria bacterium]|nr:chemotaxis protein CheW [Gammaproteobacteria bacterium]